ncbi:MAG: cellulose biosynthesis protein BcsD [Stagnimonas sp.]|nr:cellulose biosynthesis protein BcsD [Stagnimonas sp.]
MSDLEQGSLAYFLSAPVDAQWADFLRVMAEELAEQMSAEEIRAFFAVLGRRIARRNPLAAGETLQDLESAVNQHLRRCNWGWMRVRDLNTSLEFLHSCSPLRQALGDQAMDWAPGLFEGMYDEWLKQSGADETLVFQQVGRPEGMQDTLRFRLAHPSQLL